MAITQITTDFAGQIGVHPRLVRIISTDDFTTVTAAGYLNNVELEGFTIDPTDFIFMNYDSGATFGIFTPSISSGIVTLEPYIGQGDVTLPVVDGHFANFDGTTGTIQDLGYLPSDATKTRVVMANGAVATNRIACFTDTTGTVDDTTAAAIHDGNIQAGLSGTAGTLSSFPATGSKGSLRLQGVANTGDTITTISNAAMGQASVVSIPDPVAATANFVVAPSALVTNNLVKASGTAGLVVDAGARIISNTTGTYAGGGTSNTFAAVGLTSGAKGSAVIRTSTNSVSITKALPGTDTLDITFSADPGASTTVDYIYTTASQA